MAGLASLAIRNASNTTRLFYLCQSTFPVPSGPDESYSTHVYLTAAPIGPDGSIIFSFQNGEYSAVVGFSSKTASVQDSKPVVLGTATGTGGTVVSVTSSDAGIQADFGADSPPENTPGGFTVITDNSFPYPNRGNIIIGVGKQSPRTASVIPTQTWAAQPGLKTQVYPKPKYFVAFGEVKEGAVVDLALLGNVLQVDYTACTIPDARFVLNDEGLYIADPSVKKNGIGWAYGPLGQE